MPGPGLTGPHVPVLDLASQPGAPDLRRVFGRFATGVTVVTTGRAEPHGMTANAFASVSLDPPLVLVCVQRNAAMHHAMRSAQSFAVSVLAAHQEELARLFADRRRPRGWEEFAAVDTRVGPYSGAPVFCEAIAWLECEVVEMYRGGDHSIFIGRVEMLGHSAAEPALLFYNGRFQQLETASAVPHTAPSR